MKRSPVWPWFNQTIIHAKVKITTYKAKHKQRHHNGSQDVHFVKQRNAYIYIPASVLKGLNLKHGDLVEVTIRRVRNEDEAVHL